MGNIIFDLTFIFQLLNITILIGIIYFVFNLVIKLPKRLKQSEEKIKKIEKILEEINKD